MLEVALIVVLYPACRRVVWERFIVRRLLIYQTGIFNARQIGDFTMPCRQIFFIEITQCIMTAGASHDFHKLGRSHKEALQSSC